MRRCRGVSCPPRPHFSPMVVHRGLDSTAPATRWRTRSRSARSLKRYPFLGKPELEFSGIMKRYPFLGQPKLEFSGVKAHAGMVAGEPFISAIGGLLPMALCGRNSL